MNSAFTIAVHSLVFLASLPDRMASSEEIANQVFTHPARVRKIMSCLRNEGYVKTKEGIGGGYIFECEPGAVTLGNIYRSISCNALKLHWCSNEASETCLVSTHIQDVMNHIFNEAENHFIAYLDHITIESILHKIKVKQVF
ncbi:Rrf2 family transcriptional regulator [Terrilactibacillus laevilacticus]|uniref:Rrf2 family transcriptional regulator n=1 Tax=Terrilactibacillus laevilacticus TaxID=1380157 RepID=A0ABW5PLD8_9BACI|nr:Rrf2 family transcriptional regulator [Terrilactibacillus laevilacticus]